MFKSLLNKFVKKPIKEENHDQYLNKSIVITIETTVRPLSDNEEKIRELGKKATEYKGKDWDIAIDCLKQRKLLMPTVSTDYGIKESLRLPKFLQDAGRFKEALTECHDLLKNHPKDKAEIFDAMRLIYQREKIYSLSSIYGILSMSWQALRYKTRPHIAPDGWDNIQFWRDKIIGLLNKSKQSQLSDTICDSFEDYLKNISQESIDKFLKENNKEELDYLSDFDKERLLNGRDASIKSLTYSAHFRIEKDFEEFLIIKGQVIIQSLEDKLTDLLKA